MTEGDLLRKILPELHSKEILNELQCVCVSYITCLGCYAYKWKLRIGTENIEIDEDHAITYAIGAMVKALDEVTGTKVADFSSLLQRIIRDCKRHILINPLDTE